MKVVIIGNGIAGSSAARFIRKRGDHEVLMISDESWQPFSRTALMYVYMGHLQLAATHLYEDWFWKKNRIDRRMGRVQRIDVQGKYLALADGSLVRYDVLIIASGSKPARFDWPGQDLEGVQGLYHLNDLESMERHSRRLQRAVVVGGGLIGIEMVEMFHARQVPVTFLVREQGFSDAVLPAEECAMVGRHIREHGIDLRLGVELDSILDDGRGRVCAVVTSQGEQIRCGFVGLTAGVQPNIGFLRDSGIDCNRGVLVDEYLATSQPGIYAIGDCAELRQPGPGRRPIEAVWYTGRMMGQTVAATVCGEKTAYRPRLWFNSAKFFDIEYQVYGDIPARPPEHIAGLYWEHPDGKKSIRINFEKSGGAVTGFNLMGIRYRHEVCEKWILERTGIEAVLQNLTLANFDPEFFPQYERHLLEKYNHLNGTALQLRSTRTLNRVVQFLTQKGTIPA